jgi:diguanylate cyclase (GGDEF)-like protein
MEIVDNLTLVEAPLALDAHPAPVPAAGPIEPAVGEPAAYDPTATDIAVARRREASESIPGFTVMMVDDDPMMLEIVQTFLEEAGYTNFVTTSDPTTAIELARQHRPDVILLDLMMPRITGFDILQVVRDDEALRYTPVIILTAESDAPAKLKALELGATDFLLKPVDASELKLRLRNVLAFKAYQDRLADFDALTGLPNRKKFQVELEDMLTGMQDASRACAVLQIDLDRFKQINDTLGHRAGDKLLCLVSATLQRLFGEIGADLRKTRDAVSAIPLSRIAGNSFVALVPGLHNLEKVDIATSVARRVLNAFVEPFHVEGQDLFVTCSIGIAMSPSDGTDAETLLKHAEMAMYRAKQRGRKQHAFFSSEMNAHALERLTLENQLRRAVEREEFVLYYQPKVDVLARRISGVEALVRWKHPESGIIAPDKFIPLAEENGLIVEIGQWVLRAACTQIRAWMNAGIPPISVSVNVSSAQFRQGRVLHAVRGALAHSNLPPQSLTLELTESLLIDNQSETTEMLYELKDMGVRLSVDDFGTGYSSLTYLSRFPLDELKIDRSFLKGLPEERESIAIVSAIIALGRALGLKVVAEGVETQEQLAFLHSRRCSEFQGYLCSRPVPPEPLFNLLKRAATPAEQPPAAAA